ncbi:hypothetical protein LXM94_00955 [Rhizobium sp. TRM95111]|uniref:hypothetical protein n=1 Tax=Rhizobium alarense TaxID=2846851 RepID=UPI001F32A60B|nr:hypothetical protein [Rhizobium alarense]MCF3638536.1 hypothetical protein [Rhizobium alarense]
MFRLAAVLYILVATALSGAAVTTVLALRLMEPWHLAAAFAAGLALAAPLSWLLARRLAGLVR